MPGCYQQWWWRAGLRQGLQVLAGRQEEGEAENPTQVPGVATAEASVEASEVGDLLVGVPVFLELQT